MKEFDGANRIPNYMKKSEGYQPPSREEIVGRIADTGISFKGKSELGAVATDPTVLPNSLGNELAELGDSLRKGYFAIGRTLRSGGPAKDKMENLVRAHVPDYVPTNSSELSKKGVTLMRPDIVLSSKKNSSGEWELNGTIAEVETRPAGTFMVPALMEGYGIDRKDYMNRWVEHFNDRPWAAMLPKEWELYDGELRAFGRDLEKHGGKNAGVHGLENGQTHSEALAEGGHVYLFGYSDVWARSGSLDKAKAVERSTKGVIAYNPLDYFLETKAALVAMKQPWFLDKFAETEGTEHADRLDRWIGEGHVLSVLPDQNVNFGEMIRNRKQWILKRAGFDRDATESRGLVMPDDPGTTTVFTNTLQKALSGEDGPWIAQKYLPSRIPQSYYHPETGEPDHFVGASRLTPLYLTVDRHQTDMIGAISTTTFGSLKAHGGSGEAKVPGMSVMAPVLFDETAKLIYKKQ